MNTKTNAIATLVVLTLSSLGINAPIASAQTTKRTAVLLEETQLEVKSKSTSSGSGTVTLDPGKEVEILEEAGNNYKIGIFNFAEGWVEASKLQIPQEPSQEPSQTTQNVVAEDSSDANSDANQTQSSQPSQPSQLDQSTTQVSNDWVGKKPSISATITEEVEREYSSPDGCRGKRVANVISVQVQGINPEELNSANIKTYAVLNTENLDNVVIKGVKTRLAPIEVKELKQDNQDAVSPTYSHSQSNNECSCCKKRKKQHLTGFYTEVIGQDGNPVASHMSDLKRKDRQALEDYLGRKPERNL